MNAGFCRTTKAEVCISCSPQYSYLYAGLVVLMKCSSKLHTVGKFHLSEDQLSRQLEWGQKSQLVKTPIKNKKQIHCFGEQTGHFVNHSVHMETFAINFVSLPVMRHGLN